AGQNFSDYLILFRLERALNAINHSEKNLTDIAFDCGFNSIRSFNRAFQNYLKITPSEYRKTRILQENL
ncbi:MAG: helix-turn-helix transcriptional regulator, partial [Oscillospiraceae bacterium]|nr:helix-turn-helix transcriptional regulator [Oscillospiraceae bacterium]